MPPRNASRRGGNQPGGRGRGSGGGGGGASPASIPSPVPSGASRGSGGTGTGDSAPVPTSVPTRASAWGRGRGQGGGGRGAWGQAPVLTPPSVSSAAASGSSRAPTPASGDPAATSAATASRVETASPNLAAPASAPGAGSTGQRQTTSSPMPTQTSSRGGIRGGDAGRGSQPGGASSTAGEDTDIPEFTPSDPISSVGVKRTSKIGFGTGGRKIKIFVNSFAITAIPEARIYQYDVVIESDKFEPRLNLKIFNALQTQEPNIFTPKIVYDGRKIAFAPRQLPFGDAKAASFNVALLDERRQQKSDRQPRVFNVKLTEARTINPAVLQKYVDGKQSLDNDVLIAITALNVVMRMAPNETYPHNKRSFFTPKGKEDIGNGLELWRGIFQSVRPTIGRLIVTIDLATGALYKQGPLLQLCLDFLKKDNGPNLRPEHLSPTHGMRDYDRIYLQKFLNGLKVTVVTSGDKPRPIRRLSPQGADTLMFEYEGRMISVADYYNSLGRRLLYPSVICVQLGARAMVPLELCTVVSGQFKRSLPEDKVNARLRFSTIEPKSRLEQIKQGIKDVQQGSLSSYIQQFGMRIDTKPMEIDARVLNAPKIKYGGGRADSIMQPQNGAWNMVGRKFFSPANIKTWVIVIYELERNFTSVQCETVIKEFKAACEKVGMSFLHVNPLVKRENPRGDVSSQFRNAGQECRQKYGEVPALLVVILPEGGGDIRTSVKHAGDIQFGCATQCLRASKCKRAKDQYWMNVMLKVNLKLGGLNSVPHGVVELTDPANPTVVLGADVIHPAPGTQGRPSFTSVVGSVDSNCAKYVATTRVQQGRTEIISDLQDMCKHVLQSYRGNRIANEKVSQKEASPKRLYFYRDGVSEGEFKQVLDKELPMIKAACRELNMNPKITLFVVGKRHHHQAFPVGETKDKSGNCAAGTVFDRGIGHPTDTDFILLSHAGLLGTSRPAHYILLHDENGFHADSMQSLSFALCNIYGRATRSVSIPAPVYYADIVCARAKFHYDPKGNFEFSETGGTQVSGGAGGTDLEAYQAAFKPLHVNQQKVMYFM